MPDSGLSGHRSNRHSDQPDGSVIAFILEDRRHHTDPRRLAADELSAQEYGQRSNQGWSREWLTQIPMSDRDGTDRNEIVIGAYSCRRQGLQGSATQEKDTGRTEPDEKRGTPDIP